MNILLALFKYFPQGGLQKDTLRFAQEAARRGHNVTIFCSSWQGDKPEGINVLAQQSMPGQTMEPWNAFERQLQIICRHMTSTSHSP